MSLQAPPLPPEYGSLQVWWQQVLASIDDVLTTQQGQIADIAQAQADAAQALTDATQALSDAADAASDAAAAATAAATAQSTVDTVKRDTSIATGYPVPGEVLTAADVGGSTTITIAAHARRYGEIQDLSVSGGSITGLAHSTKYYVYYDDTTRADTTPFYQATANPNHALPQKAAGRHFVGDVVTPAVAAGPTTGGGAPPSGGGGLTRAEINSTL